MSFHFSKVYSHSIFRDIWLGGLSDSHCTQDVLPSGDLKAGKWNLFLWFEEVGQLFQVAHQNKSPCSTVVEGKTQEFAANDPTLRSTAFWSNSFPAHHPTHRTNLRVQCSDITNTLVGISGETARWRESLALLNEQCCHLSRGGSNLQLVCHTTLLPH